MRVVAPRTVPRLQTRRTERRPQRTTTYLDASLHRTAKPIQSPACEWYGVKNSCTCTCTSMSGEAAASNAHILLPELVKSVFEGVVRRCFDDMPRKSIPEEVWCGLGRNVTWNSGEKCGVNWAKVVTCGPPYVILSNCLVLLLKSTVLLRLLLQRNG